MMVLCGIGLGVCSTISVIKNKSKGIKEEDFANAIRGDGGLKVLAGALAKLHDKKIITEDAFSRENLNQIWPPV